MSETGVALLQVCHTRLLHFYIIVFQSQTTSDTDTVYCNHCCPYYRGKTANINPIPTVFPWLLSPLPREYHNKVPITAVFTAVTAVLPQSPSPCQTLVETSHLVWSWS